MLIEIEWSNSPIPDMTYYFMVRLSFKKKAVDKFWKSDLMKKYSSLLSTAIATSEVLSQIQLLQSSLGKKSFRKMYGY